jgi:hypothetical protein
MPDPTGLLPDKHIGPPRNELCLLVQSAAVPHESQMVEAVTDNQLPF